MSSNVGPAAAQLTLLRVSLVLSLLVAPVLMFESVPDWVAWALLGIALLFALSGIVADNRRRFRTPAEVQMRRERGDQAPGPLA